MLMILIVIVVMGKERVVFKMIGIMWNKNEWLSQALKIIIMFLIKI